MKTLTIIRKIFRNPMGFILSLCSTRTVDNYYRFLRKVEEWYMRLMYKPIYYSYFSRDCDMCEVSYVREFLGGRKRYEKMMEESYEWAEGPMCFDEISREDYEMMKGEYHMRDRVMENYENGGNGYYV